MNTEVDFLVHPRWLIPIEPANTVLSEHSLAVRDSIIVDILPQAEARQRYHAATEYELSGHALIPGLVNLHTHAAMNLLRGMGDDLPLEKWLRDVIWPMEARHVSPAFARDGTLLAAREMLRNGITTCNNMYFFPDDEAQAFADMGMRAVEGIIVLDFPSNWARNPEDYLARGLAARERWLDHPLISFSIAPHAPYSVSDAGLTRAAHFAREYKLPIHIHVHETAHEISEALATHGERPIAHLARLGILSPALTAVHLVHANETDLATLAKHGCHVAHCPTSNMKLASGIAPLPAMSRHGLNVGLGTDGAASNNRLDIFQEMRHAALLAKVGTNDATAAPAADVLRMATLGGARALGLGERIGSLEIGKHADLCAVNFEGPAENPCFDPISHLVYVTGREHVSHVWVDGNILVRDGKMLLHIDDKELLELTSIWHTAFVKER